MYTADVLRMTGHDFDHDDSVNDRAPGKKLENKYIATTELWKIRFGQVWCLIVKQFLKWDFGSDL